jgi:hypothetical protein
MVVLGEGNRGEGRPGTKKECEHRTVRSHDCFGLSYTGMEAAEIDLRRIIS